MMKTMFGLLGAACSEDSSSKARGNKQSMVFIKRSSIGQSHLFVL